MLTQFTNTAGNLTSNEVSFIIKNSDVEFIINKFKPKVSYSKVHDDTIFRL